MSDQHQPTPGAAIRSLAYTAQIGDEEAALGVAAVLGGIAGPKAKLAGPAGESIRPGLNLLVAGADAPWWNRAQDLLLDPALAMQQACREMSSALDPERLDVLQYGRFEYSNTDRIVEAVKGDSCLEQEYLRPHFSALRHPTFALHNPDPADFPKLVAEVLDNAALIIYPDGQLFAEVAHPRPAKKWASVAAQIAAMVSGTDHVYTPVGKQGPGRIATARGTLLMTCTRDQLCQALGSDDQALQQILQNSIMLDCPSPEGSKPLPVDYLREGYKMFYLGVQKVLETRRAGGGIGWDANAYANMELLHGFELEIQQWVAQLADRLKPFFRHALKLPYQLLWAFALVTGYRESHDWVLPFAMHVTSETLKRQAALLTDLMEAAEKTDYEHARTVMLRKLNEKPRMFRDLLRSYSVQRRDIHEPVLQSLVDDGLVRLRNDGLLELSSYGKQLVA